MIEKISFSDKTMLFSFFINILDIYFLDFLFLGDLSTLQLHNFSNILTILVCFTTFSRPQNLYFLKSSSFICIRCGQIKYFSFSCRIFRFLNLGLLLEQPSTSPSFFELDEADRHLFLAVLELGFEFAEFLLKFAEFIILHVGPFCNTQNIRINDKK